MISSKVTVGGMLPDGSVPVETLCTGHTGPLYASGADTLCTHTVAITVTLTYW